MRDHPSAAIQRLVVVVVTSAASTGGAAGASGVDFQNRVFAWAAASLLSEQPTLLPLVSGNVIQVGAQTGYAVDDVAVRTSDDNYALFQAKVRLTLDAAPTGALAKALRQAVTQYIDGRVPRSDGTQRAIEPGRDAIVLCTNAAAPATIRVHLSEAVTRVASQPPGTALGTGLNAPQSEAFNVALAHVRRLWIIGGRAEPTDEELRSFFRVLRIVTLNADDGRADQQAAVAALKSALPEGNMASVAWGVLVAEGQDASERQEWRDRAAIGAALAQNGIPLSPPARFSVDIGTLRELSVLNLHAMQSDAKLPVPGGLFIARVASTELSRAGRESFLIVGDAGAGKSGVAQQIATERTATEDVVVLRATDIVGANRVALTTALQIVLQAWTGPPGLVLIDGVDALRGADDREVLSGIVASLSNSRWQVIATVRTFDARNNRSLRRIFGGPPVSQDPSQSDPRLADVRHLLIGSLTNDELRRSVVKPMALAFLLEEASPELQDLLRNPFNLRLAAELADNLAESQHAELLRVRSRVVLLRAYWQWRVQNQNPTSRAALLTRVCRAMVVSRSLQTTEAEPTVFSSDDAALSALLSSHVLTAEEPIVGGPRVLAFSHNILFDYATAIYVLNDPVRSGHLVRELDSDPMLPLIARPSFDMLVDLLWENRDNGKFWQLCLGVAASQHVLASLAIASRIAGLVSLVEDLSPLAPPAGEADLVDGTRPRQQIVRHLVGAVRTASAVPNAGAAVAPLAILANHLAENASSYIDATLSADIISVLQHRIPAAAGQSAVDVRGRTVALLLDRCRADPVSMEYLVKFVARQLEHLVGLSSDLRCAIRRLLNDDAAVKQWGGSILTPLAEAVVPTATIDAPLATNIAALILAFQETRDEQVPLGFGGILPMNESRRQQAQFGAYLISQSFSELCSTNLQVAADVFCYLAADSPHYSRPGYWPLGSTGWIEQGMELSYVRDGAAEQAIEPLKDAITSADAIEAAAAVDILMERLHNAVAWAALLNVDGNQPTLARRLLPVLNSGALLTHPQTHAAAARLLQVLGAEGDVPSAALESAVNAAIALANTNELSPEHIDVIVGCLPAERITDPALATRRSELGDSPPAIPEASEPFTSDLSPVADERADRAFESALGPVHRALQTEIQFERDRNDQRPNEDRHLAQTFLAADEAAQESDSVPDEMQSLLIEAAAALSREPEVLPETHLGNRVLAALMAAAVSPHVGRLLE